MNEQLQEDRAEENVVVFEEHPVHQAMVFVTSTEAYFQAVALCPNVIVQESPHENFLEFCKHDIWAAAQRLANHWTMRLELFGPALTFVPLHQALSEREWDFLSSKCYRSLAPTCDSQGRLVEFIDREMLGSKTEVSLTSRLKCQWVLYSLCNTERTLNGERRRYGVDDELLPSQLVDNSNQQSKFEVVTVLRVNRTRMSPIRHDREFYTFFKRARDTALCVRYAHYHFVMPDPPDGANLHWFKNAAIRAGRRIDIWPSIATTFHLGSDEQVLQSLLNFGLKKQALPVVLGGEWDSETDWPLWVQQWKQAKEPHNKQLAAEQGRGLETGKLAVQPCGQQSSPEHDDDDDFPLSFHEVETDLAEDDDEYFAGLDAQAATAQMDPGSNSLYLVTATDRIPLEPRDGSNTSVSLLVCGEQHDRKRPSRQDDVDENATDVAGPDSGVAEKRAALDAGKGRLTAPLANEDQRKSTRRKKASTSPSHIQRSAENVTDILGSTLHGVDPVTSTVQLLMEARRKARNKVNAQCYQRKRHRGKSKGMRTSRSERTSS